MGFIQPAPFSQVEIRTPRLSLSYPRYHGAILIQKAGRVKAELSYFSTWLHSENVFFSSSQTAPKMCMI